jgi:pyrroline-5-carboxylate reductase
MKVGFIGAGHIARALGRGWSRPELDDPPALTYLDVSAEATAEAADDTGAAIAASLADLIQAADVVVVAVRPAPMNPTFMTASRRQN